MALGANTALSIPRKGPSYLRMETASGFGSVGIVTVSFSSILVKSGTAIDAVVDTVQGTVFKINQSGWYHIQASVSLSTAQAQGWLKNTDGTVGPGSATFNGDPRRLFVGVAAANVTPLVGGIVWLDAGDTLRFCADGGAVDGSANRTNAYLAYLGIA